MTDHDPIEYYQDAAGDHRWRVRAQNGEIIGASSEGFHDKQEARANLERLRAALQAATKAELRDAGLRKLAREQGKKPKPAGLLKSPNEPVTCPECDSDQLDGLRCMDCDYVIPGPENDDIPY